LWARNAIPRYLRGDISAPLGLQFRAIRKVTYPRHRGNFENNALACVPIPKVTAPVKAPIAALYNKPPTDNGTSAKDLL